MAPLPKFSLKSDVTPAFDQTSVRSHVEALHKLASGVAGKFVVSAFFSNPNGEDTAGGVVSHHSVGDVDGMIDAVMAHAGTPNANAYICPNLMRSTLDRGKKGGEADVVAVLALVADLDDDTGRSGTMPVDANYVVESSPGNYQCFLFLDRPLPPAEAKTLAGALKRAANADHCTVDVSHVWRVPGCLNWPNAKKIARGRSSEPVAVTVAEAWDGSLTNVDELRRALEPWAGSDKEAGESAPLGDLPPIEGVEVSDKAAEMLAANDVGDRSAWASRVVEQLAFDGLTAEEACVAFLSAPGDWFARYTNRDPRRDFERLWAKFGAAHAEERATTEGFADALLAKTRAKLEAVNDNQPPAPAFSIFDWTVDRFVGQAPAVEYLVDGVIPLGVPGMVAAMGDTGKSFAMLELHRRVSFGSSIYAPPVFGGKVVTEGVSVMVTSEDDQGEVHRRIASLDPHEERHTSAGKRMIVVPMPSAGGARAYWKEDRKHGLIETDDFKRLCDQLKSIDGLRLVTFDPLASFAHLPLNEDPAAGQFVCTSIGRLTSETGATILTAHHMRKLQKPIETLGDARDAIRGSSALVDGLRWVYAMWPADEPRAKRVCKTLGIEFSPGKVVLGGVVKANGAARRVVTTYVRNQFGLLVDRTAGLSASAPPQGDLLEALAMAVGAAAAAGSPFTKTGAGGLFEMKERLPDELKSLSKGRIDHLATQALEQGKIVRAAAKGEKLAKWLDVPGGMFAIGLGTFTTGTPR